jgi:hypothetical protein
MAYPQYAGNGGIAAAQDDYVDVPYPATVNQYDILIAIVQDSDNDTFITPTGWNEITTVNGSSASTLAAFWRRADGTETGTQRFYSNSAAGLVIGGVMARFTSCIRTGTPYGALVTNGITFSDTVTIPVINTLGDERLVVACIGVEDDKTLADSPDYTTQFHLLDTTGSDFALGCRTQEVVSPQAIPASDALLEGSVSENWGVIAVSLIPPTNHKLAGAINAHSTASGELKRKVHFAGSIAASSTTSGELKAIRGLAGAISAAATVTGAITMSAALSGSIAASSALNGNLVQNQKLEGSIASHSHVLGDLNRVLQNWQLEGQIESQSNLSGELLKKNIYYVRADGTATTKEDASNPNSASTSMSPTVWASESFEPGDTIVWSAKGGAYEQVEVSNSSSGLPDHPIVMRGEFGGAGRPWISGGIEVTGAWTKDGAADRWYTPLVASPKTRNVVADGVDLGEEAPTPSEVDQPGEWYHNQFDDRLYMGGASAPSSQFSEIWVQKNDGVILTVAGNNWVVEDLFITLGFRSDGYLATPCGFDASGRTNITVRGVGGIGHYGLAVSLTYVNNLLADELDFSGCIGGIDISGSSRYGKPLLQRSSFLDCFAVAVKIDSAYAPIVYRVETSAYERNFLLSNIGDGLIEQCKMGPISWDTTPDALLSGINITENVTSTVVRNCQIDGGVDYKILAGITIQDPTLDVEVSFVHNEVLNTNYGVLYISEFSDSVIVDLFAHNNTVVNTFGGFYFISGGLARVSVKNNIFFNYVTSPLEDPLAGFVFDGAGEQPTAFLSFSHNHYRDPRKPLTWFWKVGTVNFGAWCVATGETDSFEQNPQLKNPAAGQYWLAAGSPAAGTGDDGVYKSETVGALLSTALVPDNTWPVVQVADQNDYESPSWNRGAYLPEGADGALRLSGAINGQSHLSGELEVIPTALEGHVAAQSTLYGNLRTYDNDHILLRGAITAKSTVSGNLQAPMHWSLSGAIEQKSTLEGDLYTPTHHVLEGAIAASSQLAGDLDPIYLKQLAGAIEAQSTVDGDARHIRGLAGEVAAKSTLSGHLTQMMALAGEVAAQSTLEGDLTQIEALWELAGQIAAQSTLSGALRQIHALAGHVQAQSTLAGDLTQIEALWDLEGHVAAKSTLSGHLGVKYPLSGAIAAQSTVSGDLTQIEANWQLEGSITAQSTLAGDLMVKQTAAINDANHAHAVLGGRVQNTYQTGLGGNYAIQPGGQRVSYSFTAKSGWSTFSLITANAVPVASRYLKIVQNYDQSLWIQQNISGSPVTLYSAPGFFTWDERYNFEVILKPDATLEVTCNGSPVWSGSVGSNLLVHQWGVVQAGTTQNLDFTSWDYPTLDLIQHQVLAIDSTSHGHSAGEPTLVQNFDLVIDDALHSHAADEATPAITHHLVIHNALHVTFAEEPVVILVHTLAINETSHGHSADGPTISQTHVLAVDDASHGHSADKPVLSGVGYLGVFSGEHSHSADNVVLTQVHALAIDDALHAHAADPSDVVATFYLDIDDALHSHAADEPSLPQVHALAIDDTLHSHTSDEPTLAITHHLAIDDTLHDHSADAADPIENIDLVIDDASHGHAADGSTLTVHHMLDVADASHDHSADNCDLIQLFTLDIDDALHAHVADGLTLQERSYLVIHDTFHLHQVDEIPLSGAVHLAVDDAVHSHVADATALPQHYVLEIDDALHLHHADNLPISSVGFLGIFPASHAHHADGVTLGQVHFLSVNSASHGHSADGDLAFVQNTALVIDDAAHDHAVDPLDLGQTHLLTIDDADHAHAADPCNLTPTPILVIADCYHMHLVPVVPIHQDHLLAIADAGHAVASDEVPISQVHDLSIDDADHAHSADNVDVQHNHILVIDSADHAHSADELTLIQTFTLVIDDASHAVSSENITILVRYALEIEDAVHGHTADEPLFIQHHALGIDDADHAVASTDVVLDTPWYQTQRAAAYVDDDCIEARRDNEAIAVRIYPSEEGCS